MKIQKRAQGFSLVEVLMGVCLLGLAAYGLTTGLSYFAKYVHYNSMMQNKLTVRSAILNDVDCTATLSVMPNCSTQPVIKLLDVNATRLIPPTGVLNNWKITATCTAGQGILVNAQWVGGPKHPLYGTPLPNGPLFPSGVTFCREMLVTSPPFVSTQQPMSDTGNLCYGVFNQSNATTWQGVASCAPGYLAVAGGVNCGTDSTLQGSQPAGAGYSSWVGSCCSATGGTVYATCALAN